MAEQENNDSFGETRESNPSIEIATEESGVATTGSDDAATEHASDNDSKRFVQEHRKLFSRVVLITLSTFFVLCAAILTILLQLEGDKGTSFSIAVLSLVTLISCATSFWLYYTRSLLLKDGPALVPEKWGKILALSTQQNEVSRLENLNTFKSLETRSFELMQSSEKLLQSFLTLQETIDAREKEIERLKHGQDFKLFGKYILRFIRLRKYVVKLIEKTDEGSRTKEMKNIIRLLDDALEDSGVTTEAPEIGEDFRDIGKLVSDEVNLIETDDPKLDHKIAAVHEEAFVIVGPEATNVIQPATVSVYRFTNEQPEEMPGNAKQAED